MPMTGAVGRQEALVLPEPLDEGEDVVPAPAVEPGDVIAQLVEDLVHLEGRRQRLDQHRRLDGAARQARAVPARARTRRSTGAPRDGSRSWQIEIRPGAGGADALRRCGRDRGRSRRARPRPARRRHSRAPRRDASRAGAPSAPRACGRARRTCRFPDRHVRACRPSGPSD